MRCAEAVSILRPLQDEFALRYYDWSLDQSRKELEQDFPNLRRVRSSLVFLFLEFIEDRTRSDVHDLMTGGIKRFQPRAAELRGQRVTQREAGLHQQFVDYFSEEIILQGTPMTAFRVPRTERRLRDEELAGRVKFHQNKKQLREALKRKFYAAGIEPQSEFGAGLNFCEPIGDWYLITSLDVSGQSQLECSQRVAPRRTIDTCFTDLLAGANLLSWCGIHPNTRYDLIQTGELDVVVESVLAACQMFRQFVPEALTGLHHEIPEQLEDARALSFRERV